MKQENHDFVEKFLSEDFVLQCSFYMAMYQTQFVLQLLLMLGHFLNIH